MEYRVDELARAAGVRVDTVRFYQARGLIAPPLRRGRLAIYTDSHLERLRQVRELNRRGISLDAIRRLGEQAISETDELPGADADRSASASLLAALDALEGAPSYTEEQLAEATGFPTFLLGSLRELGLVEPLPTPEGERYTDADRGTLAAASAVLGAGIPLSELLPLAREHAAHTERVADHAIELFQRYVRRKDVDRPPSADAVATAFRELLPMVTSLVALHFQRVLLRRARNRLHTESDTALARALDAGQHARLHVSWR